MNYTRQLKKGDNGSDVRYMKDCLFELGYYAPNIKKISSNTFGNDTVRAVKKYQKANKDINGRQLDNDGIIGPLTWGAIKRDIEANSKPYYSRVLKKGMNGSDVRYMKDCLFALNYYEASIKNISNSTFGSNTEDAVILFQKSNKDKNGKQLDDDGKIGPLTWNAVEREFKAGRKYEAPAKPEISLDHLTHISPAHRDAIAKDLAEVSELRQKIVLEILEYACDASYKKEPRGMYQLGANLYNNDLKLNYADKVETERLAKRKKCLAIINGESVGQVASQTLTSMSVINNVTNMPVLRPVVAMDKLEIISIAKKINTYETSILPFEDCCTIFVYVSKLNFNVIKHNFFYFVLF